MLNGECIQGRGLYRESLISRVEIKSNMSPKSNSTDQWPRKLQPGAARPGGDVREPKRKALMPMLPDTLGTRSFLRTGRCGDESTGPTGVHFGKNMEPTTYAIWGLQLRFS